MPSPAWRRWPRRAGCGGDPLRIRPGSVERQHPLIRVGGDAHIAPGPDGQDWWDDTYQPPALAPDLPGGCGHPPLRGWGVLPRNLARPILSCVPSTPAAYGRHPLQAGEGGGCSTSALPNSYLPFYLTFPENKSILSRRLGRTAADGNRKDPDEESPGSTGQG